MNVKADNKTRQHLFSKSQKEGQAGEKAHGTRERGIAWKILKNQRDEGQKRRGAASPPSPAHTSPSAIRVPAAGDGPSPGTCPPILSRNIPLPIFSGCSRGWIHFNFLPSSAPLQWAALELGMDARPPGNPRGDVPVAPRVSVPGGDSLSVDRRMVWKAGLRVMSTHRFASPFADLLRRSGSRLRPASRCVQLRTFIWHFLVWV